MHGSIQLFYQLVGFTFVPSWGSCTSKAPQKHYSCNLQIFDYICNNKSRQHQKKTIDIENEKNKNIDPYTDILIDGKKTKKELDSTDPDTIESMNVTKVKIRQQFKLQQRNSNRI
jgi:hypothetical protein